MARRTVRPGEGVTHGAGLWAQPRRLKTGVRKRQKSSRRRETGCLQVQAAAPLQMLLHGPGRRATVQAQGSLAACSEGHGRTHRDLELGREDTQSVSEAFAAATWNPNIRTADVGQLLSETGSSDSQFQ